jgi:hypothetical protein
MMFLDILNDWRKALFIKEESFALLEIIVLSPKDSRAIQTTENFQAPPFMKIDEKRWCQASVWKGGRSFRPYSSLAGKPGRK